jgi:5'-methylthioadenosine phosphorylase
MQTIGVIGGSGFYEMDGLSDVREVELDTPFGPPSGPFCIGTLGDRQLVFLSRHGKGHRLSPSEINYRANVWGMKKVGVQWVLSVSAVGSLREQIVPGHLVVVDQFIDRTRGAPPPSSATAAWPTSASATPSAPPARVLLARRASGWRDGHDGGTYVCMEGPAFSTRRVAPVPVLGGRRHRHDQRARVQAR